MAKVEVKQQTSITNGIAVKWWKGYTGVYFV